MADQVEKCCENNTAHLENWFSVNAVKEEESKDEDFIDDKVQISETVIITEVQDNFPYNKIKQNNTTLDNIKRELSLPEIQCDMINLKTEEGISTDNTRIAFNNGLLYCEDCQEYREDYCAKCEMLMHILNKTVSTNFDTKSQEELPSDLLEIRDYFGECRIFALKVIPIGVKFGPFTGLNKAGHPWKIKGGKFVVNKNKSKYLNWMRYINPARNISKQNLQVFQYEHNLYYQSTCQIEKGDELLVHFGEEYEDSLKRNVEMNFIPNTKYTFKDAFACTYCCFGFSSISYLAMHKAICLRNAAGQFAIEELIQCPSCKIHLDQKEYIIHHMPYCCERNESKCILPTPGTRTAQGNGRKTRPCHMYKCQQCKYRTKYKGDFENHTNQHYEVKMYKCEVCCQRFKTKEVLRLHVENTHIHTDGEAALEHSTEVYAKAHIKPEYPRPQDEVKQFKCSICEFRTKYDIRLKMHVAEKHLKKFNYKCDMCAYKTNRKFYLREHIETKHLKEFKHKCNTCDYKTNRKHNLRDHIETRHLKEFKYKCDKCQYKTNRESQLNRHIEAKHLKEFKYKCDTCDYKANWKSQLKTHIEAIHLKEFKYKCDMCDYNSNRKSNLRIHIEAKHLKEFKYKCDTCDYKSNRKSSLKNHIKAIHLKEFKYKCDKCDYKSNVKSDLKEHIEAIHLKEFKYKCDRCDYKSNRKSNLKNHIKTRHLNEFKYKCETCDYNSNSKTILKEHIAARHLKEFKYKCDICDYKTNWRFSLRRHIDTTRHSEEFKYKCATCHHKTNWKTGLEKHIRTIHLKVFKYKCDMCDFKTNWSSTLKKHMEAKHLK